jgi:DNA-directed RNA polymerase specialized sigma24 family protein
VTGADEASEERTEPEALPMLSLDEHRAVVRRAAEALAGSEQRATALTDATLERLRARWEELLAEHAGLPEGRRPSLDIWLAAVARDEALDALPSLPPDPARTGGVVAARTPRDDARGLLETELARLDTEERLLLRAYFLEGSHADTAARIVGAPRLGIVAERGREAIVALRETLLARGLATEDLEPLAHVDWLGHRAGAGPGPTRFRSKR